MSLTLPTAYSNASKQGNIVENWFVQLGFFNGDADGSGDGGWDAVLDADGDANLLDEALDSSETDVTVDDGTVFQNGDFIKIESEIMKITAAPFGNILTVERGAMSTTRAIHNNNTAIYWNNFTPISLTDTTVDSVFYHGTITNNPSIRSSINLARSTAKTGNISLSVVNFQYKGNDFSAELFLGTRKYINREVKIYSQLNGDSTLSNCLQVYSGRLIDISHDDSSVSLQLTEQRPWDFITIPSPDLKTTISKQYFPVSYGEFTENSTRPSAQDFAPSKALFPVPIDKIGGQFIYSLVPRSYNGTTYQDGRLHYYEKNLDIFVPIDDTFTDISEPYESGNVVRCGNDLERGYKTKPINHSSDDQSTNPSNAFDSPTSEDTSTSAILSNSISYTENNSYSASDYLRLDPPNIVGVISELKVRVIFTRSYTDDDDGGSHLVRLIVGNSTTDLLGSGTVTTTTGNIVSAYTNNNNQIPKIQILNQLDYVAEDGYNGTSTSNVTVKDVQIWVKIKLDQSDADATERSKGEVDKLKFMYVGANGLTESWSGSDAEISYGHEVLRDLLIRYAGYTTTAPDNWSALDEDRTRNTADDGDITTWKIRWWALEPVELKKVLEQIMYEFGFIFKFRADGTGSVIHVLQTSELSAVQTFKKDDITNLKITNSPFSDLLTKLEINFEKHPADNRYLSSVTSLNSTARTNWNIQTKENIKEVNLEMNVGTPNTSGQTDGNEDFYSYYDNIFGDIKKIISCEIVNPSVSYNLETGDIIKFSNTAGEMPVEPFGDNWADFYMITDLKRSPGKVGITAREVG